MSVGRGSPRLPNRHPSTARRVIAALSHDLRVALRTLGRSPLFAAVSVLSLAVGIGANVAVFGLVNALLVRPLPAVAAGRLVRVGRTTRDVRFGTVSFAEYRELRDGVSAAADLVAHYPSSAIVTVRGEPRAVWLEVVSANYFSMLGVRPARGRGFVTDDDRASNPSPVVVISDALWRRRFGGEPAAVGGVRINGRDFTVVGVAPPDFRGTFAGFQIDAWVPVAMQPVAAPGVGSLTRREDRFLMMLGRLRPGVTDDRARATLDAWAQRLRLAQQDTTQGVRLEVAAASGVHPFIAGIVTAFLGLLQSIVALVLLIACVNLANVLLVRASARRRELAVRAALGATRWQLARLVLAESLVIAAAGGALGLVLAAGLGGVVQRLDLPVGIPLGLTLSLDGRVIAVALALVLVTAVAFGAAPALAASRADAFVDLRTAGATADRRRSRLRGVLVGAQVAVATVLLAGSGLLLRSLQQSAALDPGFDPAGVQLVSASPELLGYDETRGRALWDEIVTRATRVPGVRAATLALFVPLGSRGDLLPMAPVGAQGNPELLSYNIVRPGYFEALRIPLVAGRDFRPADDARAPDVVVVSAAMARRFFGRETALGRSIRVVDRAGHERRAEVIGIARTIKVRFVGEPPRPIAYFPFGQRYRPDMVLHVRAGAGSAAVTRQVAEAIRALEPDLAVDVESMSRATAFSLIPLRVAGSVLGFSGLVGLFLAALGVFGLVAYAVSLRAREIGIRVALGAPRAAVTRLVAAQGMRPVLAGLVLGLGVALGAGRLLRSLLVGIDTSDPVTLLVVAAVLLGSAAAALIVPVRRALRVDPAQVLRAE
ncbi:MAG: ABC transporter permease [Gemmatimonadaceae bacterium]